MHAQVAQFLVYKARKKNHLSPVSLKKGFLVLFFERNAYIRATVALEIYWRVQTCVAILERKKRKSGRKKKRKKKRSGKIMAKKKGKKGKKRKGKKEK